METCENGVSVFVSYSHRDADAMQQLQRSLAALQHRKKIELWHDRKLVAGARWAETIDEQVRTSHVILLLISTSFLSSRYCLEKEFEIAKQRAERGEATLIPVLLEPVVGWEEIIGAFQTAPRDAKPISSWVRQNDGFYEAAKEIDLAIRQLLVRRTRRDVYSPNTGDIADQERPAVVQSALRSAAKLEGHDLIAARDLLIAVFREHPNNFVADRIEELRDRIRDVQAHVLPWGHRVRSMRELLQVIERRPSLGHRIISDPTLIHWLTNVLEEPELATKLANLQTSNKGRWEQLSAFLDLIQVSDEQHTVWKKYRADIAQWLAKRDRLSLLRVLSRDPDNLSARAGLAQISGVNYLVKTSLNVIEELVHRGVTYVRVPAGSYQLGAKNASSQQSPCRWFENPDDFWISKSPIHVGAWHLWRAAGPQGQGESHCPVTDADFEAAKRYCEWAGGQLPLEDQWECAAYGGLSNCDYSWGSVPSYAEALYDIQESQVPWCDLMGIFPANGFGLLDVCGGVWEWCGDKLPGGIALVKGGSWQSDATKIKVAHRQTRHPFGGARREIGFRCILTELPSSGLV